MTSVDTSESPASGSSSPDATTCDLDVRGMDCASCATSVEAALKSLEGVRDVRVDVVGGKVRVDYEVSKIARGDLNAAIRRAGYRVEDGSSTRSAFLVKGMDCADEVRLIEDRIGRLPGVTGLQFDLMQHRLLVQGSATPGEIQLAIRQLGMSATPEGTEPETPSFWELRGRLVTVSVAGIALGVALLMDVAGVGRVYVMTLLAISSIAGGWHVVPRGLRAALNRALDMNFLMTIAAVGAWIIGEQAEAASTLFLFAVAELLESYSMDRARNAIRKLMELSPAEATVRRDGAEARVPVSEIDVGETVIVRPGEKIAVDGSIAAGQSSVNQAAITGESMPVDVAVGDSVFAGSINVQGALEVRSEKPASDSTLARIIHAVEEAQATRAPSQTFVHRFSRIYTPGVVIAAIAVAILPPLAGFGNFEMWVYRALTMLVVACPCALVISTPVTIVSGLARAARGGVLIKGGAYLEAAGAITTICFDKTGTLTRGTPAVTDIAPLGRWSENDVLSAAAAVERHSEHPLARAVLQAAAERNLAIPESTDFEALSGRGARASVNGATVLLGNERLANEIGALKPEVTTLLSRFAESGKTVVLVIRGRETIGVIAIADQTRPNARDSLLELRAAGISRLFMLTGDNEGTARAIARELSLDSYYAGLLPDDKVRVVRELEEKGERLIFVGDGVNDAPALAAATIGVAMGAAGTDVALETADVALMADDLSKLAFVVRLSRATLGVLRQNIAFAIAIKAVFLVLALGGWATLWMAIAADMGASLAVVANGLRVLRVDTGISSIAANYP